MKVDGEVSDNRLIHIPNDGYRIWIPLKEVSPRQLHFLVAAILGVGIGVAGLMVTWIDGKIRYFCQLPWTSKGRDSSEQSCLVAGLQNLGNNCFLNVILQALASCCCFHPFLQSIIDADDPKVVERTEDLPLTFALAAVLKELCILRDEIFVASPRRVMLAMGVYVSSFNLTRQQDAAEAFLHLLSSLKEEISEWYIPHYGSLADICSSPVRMISHPKSVAENDWERWQKQLFGPFDGTLGSILTCTSCSFQLSMDFEFFHCLPISPIVNRSGSIIDGCTVEDCLKQFTTSEHVDNYRCNRCSHIAAAKYLSLNLEEYETKIKKLENCIKHDSCDCKNLLLSEGMMWPHGYSRAIKQLSIGRCPKILCIQIQRASMTDNGELIKLQGHVYFPPVLDVFPFTAAATGVRVEIPVKDAQTQVKQQQLSVPQLKYFQMQRLPLVYGLLAKHVCSEDEMGPAMKKLLGDSVTETCNEGCSYSKRDMENKAQKPDLVHNQACFNSRYTDMSPQYQDELKESHHSTPSRNCIYRLVSVVEHYGRPGGGHYAVYRRAKAASDAADSDKHVKTADVHWFYVSDSEVFSVSEEAVLAAEASLLFYERIA